MRMAATGFLMMLGASFVFASPAGADDVAELRDEVRSLRRLVEAQQETIDKLTREPGKLPATKAERPEAGAEEIGSEAEIIAVNTTVASLVEEMYRKTQLHVYGTLQYANFEDELSEFDARNIELLINTTPHPAVRLGAEIEFEGTAKTSEGPRQGEVEVEQGWMELGLHRLLNLQGGVILVPFGQYNLEHFDSSREFVARPIVARRIVPTTWAEAGVGLTGESQLWGDLSFNYKTYLVNGLTDRFSDTSTRDARGAFRSDNNDNKAFVGRIEFSKHGEHRIGLSGYRGDYDPAGHAQTGVAVDWGSIHGPFELLGEYARFSFEEGRTESGARAPRMMQGLYAQANYRVWPKLLRETWLARRFPESLLTASVRWGFAEIDDDDDAGFGDNRERRLSFGVNYRPLPTFALKGEYQFNDTRRETLEYGDSDGVLFAISGAF